jgi:hypothetical protein
MQTQTIALHKNTPPSYGDGRQVCAYQVEVELQEAQNCTTESGWVTPMAYQPGMVDHGNYNSGGAPGEPPQVIVEVVGAVNTVVEAIGSFGDWIQESSDESLAWGPEHGA